MVLEHMVQERMILDHKSRPKSPKSTLNQMLVLWHMLVYNSVNTPGTNFAVALCLQSSDSVHKIIFPLQYKSNFYICMCVPKTFTFMTLF